MMAFEIRARNGNIAFVCLARATRAEDDMTTTPVEVDANSTDDLRCEICDALIAERTV